MLQHPWIELQSIIKEKWLTQKAFSTILWKKISEVNELLKWKRNITIQRDYLLHQTLWTPVKYWIIKQIDYDYSQILSVSWTELETTSENITQYRIQEQKNSFSDNSEMFINKSSPENNQSDSVILEKNQEQTENKEIDADNLERARIFRSF